VSIRERFCYLAHGSGISVSVFYFFAGCFHPVRRILHVLSAEILVVVLVEFIVFDVVVGVITATFG
jgi:hypothetical protein